MKAKSKKQKAKRPTPFVVINMAMTADGKIATANRALSSFGSRNDKQHLLALRATADALMSGARTADLNAITMGPGAKRFRRLRLRRGLAEYNLRVIVSGAGTVNPEAEVFNHKFSPILVLTTSRIGSRRLNALRAVADEVKICGKTRIDFRAALRWLREKWAVERLLCEGGGELNETLFRAGVVDELHLTVCSYIFGGRSAPTIVDGHGASALSGATNLRFKSARRRGKELFMVFLRVRTPAHWKSDHSED